MDAAQKTMKACAEFIEVDSICRKAFDDYKREAAAQAMETCVDEILALAQDPVRLSPELMERFEATWQVECTLSPDVGAKLEETVPVFMMKLADLLRVGNVSEPQSHYQRVSRVVAEICEAMHAVSSLLAHTQYAVKSVTPLLKWPKPKGVQGLFWPSVGSFQ